MDNEYKNSEVTVTISGKTATGKTTVARLLHSALRRAGIGTTLCQEEENETTRGSEEERLRALCLKGTVVTIQTIQTNRTAKQ